MAAAIAIKGGAADIAYSTDFPEPAYKSFAFSCDRECNREGRTHSKLEEGQWNPLTFWYRRSAPPMPSMENIHPDDRPYVTKVLRAFDTGGAMLWHDTLRARGATMVNDPHAARTAESKVLQLAHAVDAGWYVPDTLISNDPERIRAFLSQDGKFIHKSLTHFGWSEIDGCRFPRTAEISVDLLSSASLLAKTPGIYQRKIEKRAEIRAFCFGNTCLALRIEPAEGGATSPDWRGFHTPGRAFARQVTLDAETHEACMRLMSSMGLITASFDIMVDRDGRHIFAELNQAGQFLWLEYHHIPAVDAFSQFLLDGSSNFVWDERHRISLADIMESSQYKDIQMSESFNRCRPDAAVAGYA
ncbi:hypothetical protein MZO42_11580 [Sphingomonas psychrotolerans]|uniref:ATP-grasp domain-containing protein n=1 Tax=Sphingomonas psychrotolerans TaxID=1327635 RepID=A0ABU3N666_9SPHN|nr:hypothetical protein [Sphingomonas psychrotolerans]MDT8759339.1 hypothetical protein [Sphingomonas psychrotolerans]